MSRIGKAPIAITKGVEVKFEKDTINVKGPKGHMSQKIDPRIKIEIKDGKVTLSRELNDKKTRALHGLYRALIANMVNGVSTGFEKVLELSGVGYRAALSGKTLNLSIGFSHPVDIIPPEGISFAVEGQNKVKVIGIDKALVGQIAANIRAVRKVEPYKGKGIKYLNEVVKRKAGKAAKTAGAAGG
ncbi:MAG TPA: 50S ribosomal protein L6 [Candidatus Omnitrophota bacterium]|nr:50S ribosomal protein L6 [Candidatus Omnitrophota bacterium]